VLRSRLFLLVAGLVAATSSSPGAGAAPTAPTAFRVIVGPSNPVDGVDRKFLVEAFWRKMTRWPDGQALRPVDQPVDSPTRRRFSDDALRRPVSAVKEYWLQAIFSGRGMPPPEVDTDDQVVKFVLQNAGAIGYVSADTSLGGAKVVPVR
jgi:ABC-type phosphate transport system substrate-binding protein